MQGSCDSWIGCDTCKRYIAQYGKKSLPERSGGDVPGCTNWSFLIPNNSDVIITPCFVLLDRVRDTKLQSLWRTSHPNSKASNILLGNPRLGALEDTTNLVSSGSSLSRYTLDSTLNRSHSVMLERSEILANSPCSPRIESRPYPISFDSLRLSPWENLGYRPWARGSIRSPRSFHSRYKGLPDLSRLAFQPTCIHHFSAPSTISLHHHPIS